MQLYLAFFIFIKIKQTNMGRGDIKTKKGKIFAGSFGKSRPAKVAGKDVAPKAGAAPKAEKAEKPAAKKAAPKKAAAKKDAE